MRAKKSMAELTRLSTTEFVSTPKLPVSLILDDIRSANNVGSLFRSADCFAIEHVYLCGITARPPHRDILKTALGATESVAWSHHEDALALARVLGEGGTKLYALEQTHGSTPLRQFPVEADQRLAVVVGNEVQGVQQPLIDLCDGCIEIEQYGTKHSFNVAVAGALVIYELAGRVARV